MSHEKGVITLFPCFMGKAHLLLPWRLLLPQASKRRGSQQFSILLNIQPFNSFHPDATETQSVFCLCLPSAWLRSVFSWPMVPYHTSGVTFFFSCNISMSFFNGPPPLQRSGWRLFGCLLLRIVEQISMQLRRCEGAGGGEKRDEDGNRRVGFH